MHSPWREVMPDLGRFFPDARLKSYLRTKGSGGPGGARDRQNTRAMKKAGPERTRLEVRFTRRFTFQRGTAETALPGGERAVTSGMTNMAKGTAVPQRAGRHIRHA